MKNVKKKNLAFLTLAFALALTACQQNIAAPLATQEPTGASGESAEFEETAEIREHLREQQARKNILALQHLQEDHSTSEAELQNRVAAMLQSPAASRGENASRSVVTGVKTFVSTVPEGFAATARKSRSAEAATDSTGSTDSPTDEIGTIEPSEIPFYLFALENPAASTEGFAIACGDDRIGDVFAVVENGAYDDPENPFLDIFYSGLAAHVMETIDRYNSITEEDIAAALANLEAAEAEADSRALAGESSYYDYDMPKPPRLKTTWDQTVPYWDVPNAALKNNGAKYPTGCVATAMAQIMAYHRWPGRCALPGSFVDPYTGTTKAFSSINYPWSIMTNYPEAKDLGSYQERRSVGTLMYEVGVNAKMDYKVGISGTDSKKNAIPAFNKMGYTTKPFEAYTFDGVKASLDAKKPIFVSAYDEKTTTTIQLPNPFIHKPPTIPSTYSVTTYKGHAWVIDEYRVRTLSIPISLPLGFNSVVRCILPIPTYYVWCNFGWGGDYDGWYKSGVFDKNQGPVDDASRSTTEGTKGYYQYNIAIIPHITPTR